MPQTQTAHFPLVGGLNDTSPALLIAPGQVYAANNFEVDVDGGYRRIQGYQAYDGSVAAGAAVPGEGEVLGVWYYAGVWYAFRNVVGGASAKMFKSTLAGWVEVTTGVTLAPNGNYRFINHNFAGGAGTLKMYGCDGANKAFQFDGTTFTQLTTGMPTDKPSALVAHGNHLFLAFGASVQFSAIGNPTSWTPISGAGEIAMGDTVTGMLPQAGDASGQSLVITTRSSLHVMYGTSGYWNLVLMQAGAGALDNTVQSVAGKLMAMDDRGVVELTRSQAYGNFDAANVARTVTGFLNSHRSRIVAASVARSSNQYRLHFSDGYSLYITAINGEFMGAMPIKFDHPVTCICSAEVTDGTEEVCFGSTDGFVYQLGGTSFAGAPINANLSLAFNHFKSPRDRKRFRRMVIELRGASTSIFEVGYALDYAGVHVERGVQQDAAKTTTETLWDSFVWDSFSWDGTSLEPIPLDMTGTGVNVSVEISTTSTTADQFTISGVIFHYTPRRGER